MNDWLTKNIEKGIRKEVNLLRENGFNTECSCEHKMYIQCQYSPDGEIKRLHDLLYNNGYRNYKITILHTVKNGCCYTGITITFDK